MVIWLYKNKVKFQWTKELIFLISALSAIILATVLLAIPTKSERLASKYNEAIALQNATNSTSYYTISKDHVFVEIDFEDVEELKEKVSAKEYVYVVYGSENNATLLSQLYQLNAYAEEYEIENIYIYSSLWVEEQEDLQAVEEEIKAKENAIATSEELDLLEYPTLLVFYEGKIVFNSQDAEGIESWEAYLDLTFPKYNNKGNE